MSRSPRPSSAPRAPARESRARLMSRSIWRRLSDLFLESLNEHPVFDLNDSLNDSPVPGAGPEVFEVAALSEAQRESLYQEQWLRIFLVRVRLAALIGMFSMTAFAGFYFVLFPAIDRKVAYVTALTVAGLSAQIALTRWVNSLSQARLLALLGFVLFSFSSAAGLSVVFASSTSPNLEAARAVQFVIVASFAHILITSLVLPLRLRDTLALSVIVLGALDLGLRLIPAAMLLIPVVGALWAIGTFAFFVTLLAHFNTRLRRRAFDSAFDLALQAHRLKEISETDALTGGYNRRHSERVLVNELVRNARFARPLSVLMFDLDNFKPVNDTLGHGAGDLVLIAVHDAALAELREVDDLARVGGDEFLILLPETDEKQAQRVARRLHARVTRELKARFGHQSLLSKVTISVGALTLEPKHTLCAKDVLEHVDELLYSAKKAGKNRVVLGVAG